MSRFFIVAAPLVCFAVMSGCGGAPKDAPTVAPVSGAVTFKSQPLAAGEIVFYPAKGRSARGEIKDGKIVNVSTSKPNDGAPIGPVRVAVFSQIKDEADTTGMTMKSTIPQRYNDPEKSGLTGTVEKDKPNEFKFDLTE